MNKDRSENALGLLPTCHIGLRASVAKFIWSPPAMSRGALVLVLPFHTATSCVCQESVAGGHPLDSQGSQSPQCRRQMINRLHSSLIYTH
ncbi:hypothetical protein BDZ89DRAFT_1070443 [Hymenopellis radicata]|nr:hypothetical protein BDZ89DRAFT_1070443 [Hymenopellis radicata]